MEETDRELLRSYLTASDAFAGAALEQVDQLIDAGEIRDMNGGEMLIAEQEPSTTLWILLEGQFEVSIKGEKVKTLSEAGTIVGEISAVSMTPATASISVGEKCRAFAIPERALHAAMANSPQLAESVLRSMAKYLGKS